MKLKEYCSLKLRAQTLFALAWFHAVVQERRKFIPQSWSKFYEFTSADLRVDMRAGVIEYALVQLVWTGTGAGAFVNMYWRR